MANRPWQHVLTFYPEKPGNQGTIKRHYLRWRNEQGIPVRCDDPECQFHTQPLIWKGKKFTPRLDHTDGQKRNCLPANLRLLCPICESQLETHGGGNVGRVIDHSPTTYEIRPRRGPSHFFLMGSGGCAAGGSAFQGGFANIEECEVYFRERQAEESERPG